MKTIFFVVFTFLSFGLLAQSGSKNFIDQNYIEVTGKANMEIIPDEIYLSIILNEATNRDKLTIEVLEVKMKNSLAAIGINVAEKLMIKDMVTKLKTYTLSKNQIHQSRQYQLVVNDAKTAATVFKELELIGISNMGIEKLDHSKIEEYKNEVKVNAIAAAKEKAIALTNAVNQEIGRAMFIQEQEFYHSYQATNKMEIRAKYSSIQTEPDIDFEKIKLEYSVLVRFELK